MALQLGLKRSLLSSQSHKISLLNGVTDVTRRFKSTDVGDVIGIDLGTTNSCVAIMVSPLWGCTVTSNVQFSSIELN
jgi:hypothetical protein